MTEKPRITITVDEQTLQQIEDFRFEHRYPNRSQAMVALLQIGIEEYYKLHPELKERDDG